MGASLSGGRVPNPMTLGKRAQRRSKRMVERGWVVDENGSAETLPPQDHGFNQLSVDEIPPAAAAVDPTR